MLSFAEKILRFNHDLHFNGKIDDTIQIMNPFRSNGEIKAITNNFYTKYYSDPNRRRMILGINPGRLGAGVTGIPFTDSKRLKESCQIDISSVQTHEPSSVFMYEVIQRFGGPLEFYRHFYINSVCPLGFLRHNKKGNWVNCNYYDLESLYLSVEPFIVSSLKKQIGFGIDTSVCYVLGKKNAECLGRLNDREKLFDEIIVLAHPRYIVQYKSKHMESYISSYLKVLQND